MESNSYRRKVCLALAVAGLFSSKGLGAAYTWNLGTGLAGLWTTTTNWTPVAGVGGPIAGDSATYSAAGSFTTTFSANAATDGVTLTNGTVLLRSSTATQRTLTLNTGVADMNLSGTATLTLGSTANPFVVTIGDDMNVATGVGTSNSVLVDGSLSQLNLTSIAASSVLTVGLNGGVGNVTYRNGASGAISGDLQLASSASSATRGFLNLESGATVSVATMSVADVDSSSAEGVINLSGAGTILSITNAIALGNTTGTGQATVNVGNGSTLSLLTAGHTLRKSATIFVASGGTLSLGGTTLDVIGGVIDSTAGGTVSFGNANVAVSSGGAIKLGTAGAQVNGTIIVNGGGSTFSSTGTLNLAGGALGISAGGTGTLGPVSISSSGLLQVEAGGTATATTLQAGSAGSVGDVSVGGTLTQNGASAFTINGPVPGGGASTNGITVSAGGVFNAGTGSSSITNGLLSVNGTANLNGPVVINSSGRIEVVGATSQLNANQSLTLNSGSVLSVSSTAGFTLATSKSLNVNTGAAAFISGTRNYVGNALTIGGTSTNTLGNVVTIGNASTLNVVTGAGGSLSVPSLSFVVGSTGTVNGGTLNVTSLLDISGNTTVVTATNNGNLNVNAPLSISSNATLRELTTGQVNLNSAVTAQNGSLLLNNGSVGTLGNWYLTNSVVSVGTSFDIGGGVWFYAGQSTLNTSTFTMNGSQQIQLAGDLFTATGSGSGIGNAGTADTTVDVNGGSITLSLPNAQLSIGSNSAFHAQNVQLNLSNDAALIVPIIFAQSSTKPVAITLTNGAFIDTNQLSLYGQNTSVLVESQALLDVGIIDANQGANITLNGGIIQTQAFTNSSGANHFDWIAGTVHIAGIFGHTLGSGSGIGSNVELGIGKTFDVDGVLGLPANTSVHLNGGALEVADLLNTGGQLVLDSGALRYTGTSLSISSTSAFGSDLTLKPGLTITATQLTNNGLVHGDGTVTARLLNDTLGELRVDGGQTARFVTTNPIGHTNNGRITLNGGRLDLNNALSNGPAGDITGRGTLVSAGLSNAGDLALSSGISDIYGDVLNLSGGRILLSGNSDTTFWDDVTNNAGATLRVSSGSSATFFGTYSGGSITGSGTVYFEADVTPGFSPAQIAIGGDVRFSEASNLVAEINGATRGSQYDAIDVAGAATLTGQLTYPIAPGYDPAYGVRHNVLHATNLVGQFQPTPVLQLSATKWVVVLYDVNDVLIAAALPGDANVDGTVGFDDLLALAQHYNLSSGQIWQTGDFEGNGSVAFEDLLILAQHYGNHLLSADQVGQLPISFASDWAMAQSLVPEPATVLAMLGSATMLRRRVSR